MGLRVWGLGLIGFGGLGITRISGLSRVELGSHFAGVYIIGFYKRPEGLYSGLSRGTPVCYWGLLNFATVCHRLRVFFTLVFHGGGVLRTIDSFLRVLCDTDPVM